MIQRSQSVTRKVGREHDVPPKWQKNFKFERLLQRESKKFNKDVRNHWLNYHLNGVDAAGFYRTPLDERKPSENYYNSHKIRDAGMSEYDRYILNQTVDPVIEQGRAKKHAEIMKMIGQEDDSRKVPISINSTYGRVPKYTDSILDPWFRHPPAIASFTERARVGIFPPADKYMPLNSTTIYTTDLPYQYVINRDF